MKKSKSKVLLSCIALIVFGAFIYMQSNTPYQDQDMKPLLKEYLHLSSESLPPISFRYDHELVTTEQPYAFIEFSLRKLGHVLEYAGLTVLIYLLLSQFVLVSRWTFIFCLLFSLAYAITDEWHQRYTPGRTGHLIDVFTFDLIGILIALIIIGLTRKIRSIRTRTMNM